MLLIKVKIRQKRCKVKIMRKNHKKGKGKVNRCPDSPKTPFMLGDPCERPS